MTPICCKLVTRLFHWIVTWWEPSCTNQKCQLCHHSVTQTETVTGNNSESGYQQVCLKAMLENYLGSNHLWPTWECWYKSNDIKEHVMECILDTTLIQTCSLKMTIKMINIQGCCNQSCTCMNDFSTLLQSLLET